MPPVDNRWTFPQPGAKSEQVLDLLRAGVRQVEIARQLRVSRAHVCVTRRRAAERGVLMPLEDRLLIEFGGGDKPLVKALHQEALARAVDTKDMIRSIIRIVAQDNLFDAVLGGLEDDDDSSRDGDKENGNG